MNQRQFRVLYRQFLFRMVDLELLSAHALGDSTKLLGQFAALLIFISFGLSIPAFGVGGSSTPPALRLFHAWSAQHFLIATTMAVVGIFAVLSWDSTFPDRRDVFVIGPLPIRPRTLFLAKVAAAATSLSLTVALLNTLPGLAWSMALGAQGTVELDIPALGNLPAAPPASPAAMEAMLQRDLAPWLPPEMGVAIGIVKQGERRVFTYGAAKPDSLYQIGSISKTFTGLLLAHFAEQGALRLNDPVRLVLPRATVRNPHTREITLQDLATHHSGLPPIPDNLDRSIQPNPAASYTTDDLFAYISRRGVAKPANPPFHYSNLGYALLGQALAVKAGMSYEQLLAHQITTPLHLRDTTITLTPEQRRRAIEGYSVRHEPRPSWDIGAFAPAGGIWSTAGDLLTYLEHQLQARSSAIRISQQPRAELIPGMSIALAWIYDEDTGAYWHNGAISGFTSHALFHPKQQYGIVVLVNQALSLVTYGDLIAFHIRSRLTGQPAVSLAMVNIPQTGGFLTMLRILAAYWITMFLAGMFAFCAVLVLQGLAAQLLPRRTFLRLSSLLQLAAFCAILCYYLLQPLVPSARTLIDASGSGWLAWSPTYWFLGLLQQMNGSPALPTFAARAWIGLATLLSLTAIAYTLSYLRTLRRIAEEPDIVPAVRGGLRMPRFGNALHTAIVHFSIRTLMRSRLHRLILAFYLGIGLAFLILMIKAPAAQQQLEDAPAIPWGQANSPLLGATIAMMGFAIIGTRVVFSLPLDLRANWIFRVTGVRYTAECLHASRRSLLVLSFAPVWIASAIACFWLWPWRPAAGHLAILAALGLILAGICLHGFEKLPFTCSYLPGKSQVHLSVLAAVGLLWSISLSVRYERQLLEDPQLTTAAVCLLMLIAAAVHWSAQHAANTQQQEVQFEDSGPVIQTLGLTEENP